MRAIIERTVGAFTATPKYSEIKNNERNCSVSRTNSNKRGNRVCPRRISRNAIRTFNRIIHIGRISGRQRTDGKLRQPVTRARDIYRSCIALQVYKSESRRDGDEKIIKGRLANFGNRNDNDVQTSGAYILRTYMSYIRGLLPSGWRSNLPERSLNARSRLSGFKPEYRATNLNLARGISIAHFGDETIRGS